MNVMPKTNPTIAEQIAQAATVFQQQRTGHVPKSVSVMVDGETLVITLHGALSPAEQAMVQSPEGAAKVQEFHRQLFHDASDVLRQEIKRITSVEVRDASVEMEPTKDSLVQVLPHGTMVQVFLLAKPLPAEIWNGSGADRTCSKDHSSADAGTGGLMYWISSQQQSSSGNDSRKEISMKAALFEMGFLSCGSVLIALGGCVAQQSRPDIPPARCRFPAETGS